MAAGMRAVLDLAKLVDIVLEVRDARIPQATAVVELHKTLKQKPRIVLLNRADLASPNATRRWVAFFERSRIQALSGIGTRAESLRPLRAALLSAARKRARIRIAVVGAPNTGVAGEARVVAMERRPTSTPSAVGRQTLFHRNSDFAAFEPRLESLRTRLSRGRPFGAGAWQRDTARPLVPERSLRRGGRPRKATPANQ